MLISITFLAISEAMAARKRERQKRKADATTVNDPKVKRKKISFAAGNGNYLIFCLQDN